MNPAYKQEINGNSTIIHTTDLQLSQIPQIKEGIQYIQEAIRNNRVGRQTDISQYSLISEACSYTPNFGGGCYPVIPFKISEIPRVAELLGVQTQLKDGIVLYLEYHGDYYVMSLYQPNLQPIHNSSLLYGIIVSIVGSLAIWLIVARIKGRKNREQDMRAEGVG